MSKKSSNEPLVGDRTLWDIYTIKNKETPRNAIDRLFTAAKTEEELQQAAIDATPAIEAAKLARDGTHPWAQASYVYHMNDIRRIQHEKRKNDS